MHKKDNYRSVEQNAKILNKILATNSTIHEKDHKPGSSIGFFLGFKGDSA